ncbi:MAG: aspartate aminotransferase family protein [Candidatus Hydrogenedentes bacterium]|nr:aspartate aminotransferase family protein [Candidatus Hydrogenedentota bacterium]
MREDGRDKQFEGSRRLLERARQSVAGGANSNMRVLPYHLPLAIDRAEGARVWDVDGNELIDMNMGYGPLIFGHRPAMVLRAIEEEIQRRGTVLGFPHELSHQVAELVKKSFPSIDLLRFSSTGTETAQTAVRLARAHTGRPLIVMFEGHYHGSSDAVFHRYHAPLDALAAQAQGRAIPGTAGMNGAPRDAIVLPWNDADTLSALMAARGEEIAAIIMEPVAGNAGVIPPRPGFLQCARVAADAAGSLLILDEVITGFRIARGGAQQRFGVRADLTLLAKALSGGVPVGAVGGRADIMQQIVDGRVFHGGVYSGNPMSMAAALAVQRAYDADGERTFADLERGAAQLAGGLRHIFVEAGVPALVRHVGAMLSCFFLKQEDTPEPMDYRAVAEAADAERYIRFQHRAQRAGVYFHPNLFEPWYLSTAHTPAVIDEVLERLETVAKRGDWLAAGADQPQGVGV